MDNHYSIKKLLENGGKIPLFDIDGTLVTGGKKIHHEAFDFAFKTIYNQPDASVNEITVSGMIDTQILIEVLKLHNVPEQKAKEKLEEAMKAMVRYFERHKEKGNHMLINGVLELLQKLQKKKVPAGLLTGNVEQIGWSKMQSLGIKEYFTFGAFGNLAFERADLITIAKERIEKLAGIAIPLNHFVIIGDTPLDIACARNGGIEVIAVSTGKYSKEALEKLNPDLAISSLHETEKILQFLRVA
jgi:phosphoglycolate phosphatase-like HAD superfamily hydrolase